MPATSADTVVFLDLLGPQRASEKGTTCPGELPPASDPELVERARAARATLGERAFVLGHHYQRDEVIQFADARGDSFRLAQQAAARAGRNRRGRRRFLPARAAGGVGRHPY